MKLQNKHALFFILILLLVIGILGAVYFFFFIHQRVSHKKSNGYLAILDFDGDRKTDIAVYRSNNGGWYINPSSGAADYVVGWGGLGYTPVPGDYDGDGKTDIAVYRESTGAWYVMPSSGGAPYSKGLGGDP
jgi:hypothetical protein